MLEVKNRSSVASKMNLVVGACVVDPGYDGELFIDLHNIGNDTVFVNAGDPYKIMFYHDKVFGTYQGPITVGYDLVIRIEISVWNTDTTADFVRRRFPIIAQNPLMSENASLNTISLEI